MARFFHLGERNLAVSASWNPLEGVQRGLAGLARSLLVL